MWDNIDSSKPSVRNPSGARKKITKDRYGEGVHYEVFGHAFLRNDGRVCAWFAGRDRDAIELCEGFRVLSRNRNNPNEEMP
ncbi:hypothetical protein ANCDUO_17958 [Ancylostoma duodenale]|uniref:Uncharacterized protein n=1 Tax=Ancylostoma duodenale TaxID=51022 RepID=A0A0C2CQA4_9BILA|nr:hypothetical protein ANCDUO_17958 [Ancylostoma duodenale]